MTRRGKSANAKRKTMVPAKSYQPMLREKEDGGAYRLQIADGG